MDSAVSTIFSELDAKYRHSFVITQNIRDYVWEDNDPVPFSFPIALCRRLSRGSSDASPILVAYYAISRGIRLYHNGEGVRDESLEKYFRDCTDLGSLLNAEFMSPEQLQKLIQPPHTVLPRFTKLLAGTGEHRCCLVIDSADNLVNPQGANEFNDRAVVELLESWGWDSRIKNNGNSIVLLCAERSHIPDGIVSVDGGYTVAPVAYPNLDERRAFLATRGVDGARASMLANLTTGFRRIDLEEARQRSLTEKQISAKKAEIIRNRCGDSLELMESTFGLEGASAQPHVKEYLLGLKKLILSDRKDASVPNGLLFVGVPGNGKSHITKAFAHDCGMNMLRFKNVRSQWVGESERNLNTVLDILPALAPCVVFIDEIDQVIHSRSGSGSGAADSGVENRMLARLLEFMGDTSHRGDIIWIGATNRPDLLDPAMPRRLGRVFPFMNPTSPARDGLIRDLVSRLALPFSSSFDYASAAESMHDYSCDDVEKVVVRAREVAFNQGDSVVENKHIEVTCKSFKHNYNRRMYEFIGLLSVEICNFVSDLPWCDDQGSISNPKDLPWFLQPMVDNNRINMDRVADRLISLRETIGLHA